MNIFSFKLLSRFPEINFEGKSYLRIPPIFALRFSIYELIQPKRYRIIFNGNTVSDQQITRSNVNLNNKIAYYNIWVNLSDFEVLPFNILTIEMKFFGFYIKIFSKGIIILDHNGRENYDFSDSYINPRRLTNKLAQGEQLERQIFDQPANIRSTKTDFQNNTIENIILLRLDQLGDFILTLNAVAELRSHFPNTRLTMVVSPNNESIAKSVNLFDYVYSIPFSFEPNSNKRSLTNNAIEGFKSLVENKYYDFAIDLSPMPESRQLLDFVEAGKKFGFENTNTQMIDFGLLIHAKDPINCLSDIVHPLYPLLLVDAVKRVAKPTYVHLKKYNKDSPILKTHNLSANNYIVIHSGSRNLLVRWPIENFVSLTNALLNYPFMIVFFSDEPVDDKNREILNKSKKTIIIDYKISFDEFDTILAHARIFIGNDSGPKHLAAMRDTQVISIHSPRTNWNEWGQIDSGYIVSKSIPCAGCAIITEDQCARKLDCVKSIKIDEVLEAVKLTNLL